MITAREEFLRSYHQVHQIVVNESPEANEEIQRRVFSLLERLEDHNGAGILSYSRRSAERGKFVVDDSRVCLAIGPKGSRLKEVLSQISPETKESVSEALHIAKVEDRPLKQVVKELGEPTIGHVRQALRRQTALACIELAQLHVQDELDSWFENQITSWEQKWSPAGSSCDGELAFSFSPFDIYLDAAKLLDTSPPDRASRHWAKLSSLCQVGGLFLRVGSDAATTMLPISTIGSQLQTLKKARKSAHAVHKLSNQWSLLAAGKAPETLMLGHRFNDWIFVTGESRVALFRVDDIASRAQITGSVLRALDKRAAASQ